MKIKIKNAGCNSEALNTYKEQLKKMQIRLNTKKEKNSRRKELNSDEK